MMTDAWWAPYLFIAIAGWLATDLWRWLGVIAGNRLKESSETLNWVRAVATALVMAVTAKLIVFPTGTLEHSPMWLRIGAATLGFAIFLMARQKVLVGVLVPILLLAVGLLVLDVR
ncbi:AzlD domain-containing protein [Agrobacterium rubi]|uniref:AzlD domain-containing protein n=1 Tax=Agrobacterium rubi TaxID=28099 RepID=UPI0015724B2C|nr:AzlD domain-containing protein [Agrobacterium rubi]NTF07382.1 AzlD domain-containing protein [Agrobacterium rubi]NTF19638.1 AzlD domain-containing protein [Agrobacterium rubi]NTF26601.1 AzlD domain-containing protein [Agrobacterium rubi]